MTGRSTLLAIHTRNLFFMKNFKNEQRGPFLNFNGKYSLMIPWRSKRKKKVKKNCKTFISKNEKEKRRVRHN